MQNIIRTGAFVAAIVASGWATAQSQDFEALVEDALRRGEAPAAPPAAPAPPPAGTAPPATAVPPRIIEALPPPGADAAEGAPPAAAAPPPPPAAAGPRPYTPPAASAGAGQTPSPPAATAPARSQASLRVDEVNSAVYREDAEAIDGASPLILKAQVLLDRAGASPGVIDALYGGNVAKAIGAVETVLGLPVDGELDRQVWEALGGDDAPDVLVAYEVTAEDAAYPFLSSIPADYAEQARLSALGFTSPAEMFAERFHMDIKLLQALNPGADFGRPGTSIVVADVRGAEIVGKIARIEADKGRRQIRAYDAQNRLVVAYPATIGSADNPSPSGEHVVEAVAPDPVYYYDPKNFVQGSNTQPLQLPPGPNNPVGTMWIDLSEPSYGIHGTPEPSRIDKTGSHGCVRLTNWDAVELAGLVDPGVVVSFVE